MFILTLILAGMIAGMSSCSKESKDSNAIEILSITPSSPADMPFGEYVLIRYDYQIGNPEGALMWIQPYTDGGITPNYLYSSSKTYTGTGFREVGISVKDGDQPVLVDQLKIIMKTPDKEKTLYESFMDVNFTFSK